MRYANRLLAVSIVTVLAVGGLGGLAHAATPARTAASPAANSIIKTAPTTISATFSESLNLTLSTLTVTRNGTAVTCPKGNGLTGTTLSCTPSTTPADGDYVVSYSAIPASPVDTTASGSFPFTLDTAAPVAPTLSITNGPYNLASTNLTITGKTEKPTDTVDLEISTVGSPLHVNPTVNADSTFSYVFSSTQMNGLSDGALEADAASTDLAGNTSAFTTTTSYKDVVPPTVDTTSPVNNGAAQPASFRYVAMASEALKLGTHVDLYDAGNNLIPTSTAFSAPDTAVTSPRSTLPDGTYTAHIFLIDASGNPGPEDDRPFTIDSSPPAAPVITHPATNVLRSTVTAYPVSGTGEIGATVLVNGSAGNSVSQAATVGSDGTWSMLMDLSTVNDGTVTFNAFQTDKAGNQSAAATARTTLKDVVVPRVTNAAVNPPTLAQGSTVATVSGKVDDGASTNGESDVVTITVSDSDPSTADVVTSAHSGADGTFSITADAGSESDGTLTYTAVAQDVAGNPSSASTVTNSKDTGAPSTPTATFGSTAVNNTNKTYIQVLGATDAGTTVSVLVSDGTHSTTKTATSSGTQYVIPFDLSSFNDGTIIATVQAHDSAGNASGTDEATIQKDTGVPAAPTLNSQPYVINPTLHVTGTGEPGAEVEVSVGNSTNNISSSNTIESDGAWFVDFQMSNFDDGPLQVTATQTDAAGNLSPASTMRTVKDTVAPQQPATLTASPDPYNQSSTVETVTGTTQAADQNDTGLTVTYTLLGTDNTRIVDPGEPVSSGAFHQTFSAAQIAAFPDGLVTVDAFLSDAGGNRSDTRRATFYKDTTVLALQSSDPAQGSLVSKPAAENATYNEALAATTTVTLTDAAGNGVPGTLTLQQGNTVAHFVPTTTLADGSYTETIHAVDQYDAADTEDDVITFSVDSTPPAVPVITSITNPINTSNVMHVSVKGTSDPNTSINLSVSGVVTTVVALSDGTWEADDLDVTAAPDGTVTATADAADSALNLSASSAPKTALKDTVAPTLSSTSPANGSTVAPPASIAFTFSEALDPSSTLSVSVPHATVPGTTAVSGSTITFTPSTPLVDQTYTAIASIYDRGLNPLSSTISFTVDGTGPTISGLTANNTTSAAQVATVTGTRSELSTVVVRATDGVHTLSTTVPNGTGDFTATFDEIGFKAGSVSYAATGSDPFGNVGATATYSGTRTVTPDRLFLQPIPATVARGQAITVTGKLNRQDTSVPAGKVVVRAKDDSGVTTVVATLSVNASSTYTFSFAPRYNAVYQVSYAGDARNGAASSQIRRTNVAVRISAMSKTGSASRNATITGSVLPDKVGQTVTLYAVSSNGKLTRLASGTVSKYSTYQFTIRLSAGSHVLQVGMAATKGNVAGAVRFLAKRT